MAVTYNSMESSRSGSRELNSSIQINTETKKGYTLYVFIFAAFVTITLSTIGLTQGLPVISSIAQSKGLSSTEIGLIYCAQSIQCAILFPISSVILTRTNKKLSLCVSSLLIYCSYILYGLVPRMTRTPFLAFSLIFSSLEAFCETMIFLSANLIIWETFPNRQSTMFAIQELSIAIGYVSGPGICAVLYPWLGFFRMYLLVGVAGLLVTMVIASTLVCLRNEERRNAKEGADPWLIVRIVTAPSLCLHLAVIFITAFFFNYFYPVIGPYLISRYHVTVSTVGWVIMSGELVYMLASILLGYLYDNYATSLHIVVSAVGLFFQAIGMFLYPPSSLLFHANGYYIPWSAVGSMFNGMGIALCFIPILTSLLMKAEAMFPDACNVEPSVAGLFTGAYYLGEGMGQFLSGLLADYYSLDVISTFLSAFLLIAGIFLLVLGIVKFKEIKL